MIKPLAWIATIIFSCVMFLQGCGSDAHGAYSGGGSGGDTAPTAPANISGNAGDGAVSLGWDAPTTGSTPFTYNVTITPAAAAATITSNSTHAMIRGLSNGTTYTFAVTTKNNAGESSASTILLKPIAAVTSNSFQPVARDTTDLNSPSGIFDTSLLNEGSMLWMAYSSVNYYQQSGQRVQDVSTSLAYSSDSGATFKYLNTIGKAQAAIINSAASPCGNVSCSGRWVYETPFLVDDTSDPNTSQRFKLFALKYFLYPPAAASNQSATFYALGAIVMWTAATPDSLTSAQEQVALSWDLTPNELSPKNNIKNIDANLGECIVLTEGSATTFQDALDFVFACPNSNDTQKIVMLRSSDHAQTFQYVSTPLTAADASSFGALYFSAPALLPTESSAPILLATPVINRPINGFPSNPNAYSGCIAFAFSDENAGTVFRNSSTPMALLQIPAIPNHLNGACAWDRGIGNGILMNDYNALATEPFSIFNTTARF